MTNHWQLCGSTNKGTQSDRIQVMPFKRWPSTYPHLPRLRVGLPGSLLRNKIQCQRERLL